MSGILAIEYKNYKISQIMETLEIPCDFLASTGEVQWKSNIESYDVIMLNYDEIDQHAFIILGEVLKKCGDKCPAIIGYSRSVNSELKEKGKKYGVGFWVVSLETEGFRDVFKKLLANENGELEKIKSIHKPSVSYKSEDEKSSRLRLSLFADNVA